MATEIATVKLNIPDPKMASTMSPRIIVGKVISMSILGSGMFNLTPSRIIPPQLGVGGLTPNPMKLRFASWRMAVAIQRVPTTRISLAMLGRMWTKMMRKSLIPRARAAWI